jgi:hypothetical protein
LPDQHLCRRTWLVSKRLLPSTRERDLFGIGDVIAFHPRDRLALLVQCTSLSHVGYRLRRIRTRPELPSLLRAGVAAEVWSV